MLNEIEVQVADVENVRYVLRACLTFLQARDMMEAQINLTTVRPSPLTLDVEKVAERFERYYGQFLIEKRDAELAAMEEYDIEVEEDDSDDPEASDELTEASEEEGDDEEFGAPFGDPDFPRQRGRRLSHQELVGEEEEDEEEGDDE